MLKHLYSVPIFWLGINKTDDDDEYYDYDNNDDDNVDDIDDGIDD